MINHAISSNAGIYVCDAINEFGAEKKEVEIKVLLAPKVFIEPSNILTVEGSKEVITCTVENGGEDVVVSWIDIDGNVVNNVISISSN